MTGDGTTELVPMARAADAALLAALLAGSTIAEAAAAAGMSERTARRRLHEPVFLAELREARRAIVASAVAQLSGKVPAALAALDDLLQAGTTPSVRLGAVRDVLQLLARLAELDDQSDLAERVASLEHDRDRRAS